MFRFADQRNPRFALGGFRFQAIAGSDSTISGRKAAQQIEDGVFAGRGSNRTGLHSRTEEMASALSRFRWTLALPESSDRSTVSRRLDSHRLPVPSGLKLGLGRIGFHTFRHTYRAWLDETGAPVGVQQKLMRHAHVSTTMDQYGNASALAKRKANRPIVQRLLRRSATQQISIQ